MSDRPLAELEALSAIHHCGRAIFEYGHPGLPIARLVIVDDRPAQLWLAAPQLRQGERDGATLEYAWIWTLSLDEIPLPASWPASRIRAACEAMANGDAAPAQALIGDTLAGLVSGPLRTGRGNAAEFEELLRAMADLAGDDLHVIVPATPRGELAGSPETPCPGRLRLVLRHALCFYDPSCRRFTLVDRKAAWIDASLLIQAEYDAPAHRRLEAGKIVLRFYAEAAGPLQLDATEVTASLATLGLA